MLDYRLRLLTELVRCIIIKKRNICNAYSEEQLFIAALYINYLFHHFSKATYFVMNRFSRSTPKDNFLWLLCNRKEFCSI